MGERVLFLDRDGTLIVDRGYPRDPAGVAFLEGALDALRELSAFGFRLAVVSNQSGVGRGILTEGEVASVRARFEELAREAGVDLSLGFYCFHAPEAGCACRKPETGLLREAEAVLGPIDYARSFIVGDKESDVLAGKRLGTKAIRFGAIGSEQTVADHVVSSWKDVLRIVKIG